MDEEDLGKQNVTEKPRLAAWIRNIVFLILGIITLLLGSFLLTDRIGPEALFVILLWCLPLFVH